ncbi:MXAN_6640 family putative metalloprotease [Nocardioides hwasunensis]|uniref:Neutral metalloproteinase n=1 Tax=Nocardioides hwasunensis TaxID=397258 RepID=A0ABR8MJG0_9ACTN|nr:MXAN_6640 family putative metalloprotease [Nocardioides hwasunensis]MBD3914887.1 hypothetical protein [Nocardioides hwasunensis]
MRPHPRSHSRSHARAVLLSAVLALTLGTTIAASPTYATDPTATPDATTRPGETTIAEEALAAAESAVVSEPAAAPDERTDLTLAMRDLFVAKHALRGSDRATAERLLARPTTPPDDPDDPRDISYGPEADLQTQCSATFCLHWVEEGQHATTPAFAATAFDTITHVAGVYAAAGFKRPLRDAGQEGDTRMDFYLGDIDSVGALGYCRSDADGPVVGSAWYAYCGFDNDYASTPWLDPTAALQITVAHEYFHAVQFAYDAEDDGWLMESTATAMEDVLYTDVNDNAFFLNYGQMGDPDYLGYPLAGPSTSLDTFDLNAYGNWGFWRFLTEKHADTTAGVPNLVRQVWEALDTTKGVNTRHSLQAIDKVLVARGTSTPEQYAAFADANQHPSDVYSEAVEQAYPTAPNTLPTIQLAKKRPIATHRARLDHLTSATGAVQPFAGSKWLTVAVDLGRSTPVRAVVTVHRVDGSTSTTHVRTNKQGYGVTVVPFASAKVASVEVTLANGSTRMTGCGGGSAQACGGTSPDDGLVADVGYLAVG